MGSVHKTVAANAPLLKMRYASILKQKPLSLARRIANVVMAIPLTLVVGVIGVAHLVFDAGRSLLRGNIRDSLLANLDCGEDSDADF